MTGTPDELLTTAETAAILGFKINTLEIWRVRGNGPAFVKMGDGLRAHVRYRRADVIAWLENRIHANTSSYSAALASMVPPRPPIVKVVQIAPAPNAPWLKSRA